MTVPHRPPPGTANSNPVWPPSLEFESTVEFYRDLVRLPVLETFANSYSSDGVIFGLPDASLTFEIVRFDGPVQVDPHEQLCLYFPGPAAMDAARRGLVEAGIEPVVSHPFWAAHGAVTYRDPDGRELVFAPFVY